MPYQNWKVLIAEDHVPSRRLIEQALEPVGCKVISTSTGRDALQAAEALGPDLIFLDVNMPDMNGYEACQAMRQHPLLAEVPIVLISAMTDRASRIRGLEAGADDYLGKPVDILELQTRIRTLLRLNRYRRLHEMRSQFEMLLEASPDIILIVLEDGRLAQANWAARAIGLEPPAQGAPAQFLPQVLGPAGSAMLTLLKEGGVSLSSSHELTLTHGSNAVIELEWRASEAAWNGTTGWLVILRDVSERKAIERERWRSVRHDALTGLPNRVYFAERLETLLEQGETEQLAVLLLDIDQFNSVNESLGLKTGDNVLKQVCARVQSVLSPGEFMARVGEDELVVLTQAPQHVEARAHALASACQAQMHAPFQVGARRLFLNLSVGITLPQPGQDAHDILRDASVATARARALGRGQRFVFDKALHVRLLQRLDLEAELRQALGRQELCLYYQPLVSLKRQRLEGFEALMRWNNRERGMVSPGEFIPLAESSGMIESLGLWAFEAACRRITHWTRGPQATPLRYLSVNLSVNQLLRPTLVDDFQRVLDLTGADPRQLVLEITESVIMQDAPAMIRKLEGLRALGMKLSLDDFGTGYSSLSYLQQLPLDGLKIDKVFVQCLAPSSRESDIVGMVVQLGHRLGFQVTAEGIETEMQLRQCQLLDVDYGQGYYLGQPLPEHLAQERVAAAESLLAFERTGVQLFRAAG